MIVLMPLPSRDFDPTEVCVTWQILREAGHEVRFATPDGLRAQADPLMISGEGLDPWGWIAGLKKLRLLGLMLRARQSARQAYALIQQDPWFLHPMSYEQAAQSEQVDPSHWAPGFDALVLPGGHAKGMRVYLESTVLQGLVAHFFDRRDAQGQHRPVAAVCHGVLLAARSRSALTGRSVLWGRRTTALTWQLERSAWHLTRWWARFWDPLYYRTYAEAAGEPPGYWSVEAEVKRALAREADFCDVPDAEAHRWRRYRARLPIRHTPAGQPAPLPHELSSRPLAQHRRRAPRGPALPAPIGVGLHRRRGRRRNLYRPQPGCVG